MAEVKAVKASETGRQTSRPRVRSISDQVTDTVRRMILMGELRPNDQVTQDQLAAQLGVSTMPVREALLRLSHEGLIVGGRGRSFRVARTTREDISDIYWMHAALAGELTARAATRRTDADLVGLEEIHEEWKRAAAAGDEAGLEARNFEFHRLINHVADAPTLLRGMRNTLRMIPEHFYAMIPAYAEAATRQHERILDALRRGDAEEARAEAAKHVEESGAMLIDFFGEKGFWTAPETGS